MKAELLPECEQLAKFVQDFTVLLFAYSEGKSVDAKTWMRQLLHRAETLVDELP